MRKKCGLLVLLVLVLMLPSFAQVIVKNGRIVEYNDQNNKNRIPIKIVSNHIIIPLQFDNGATLNFLLDTGVTIPVITEPMPYSILGLVPERDIEIKGYGREKPLKGTLCKEFNFNVNNYIYFDDLKAIILHESLPLSDFLGEPIFGLIGYDFFKDYRVEINYQGTYIKLNSNKRPFKKKKYDEIDLNMVSHKPYLSVEIEDGDKTDSLNILIDTGFSGALSLYPKAKNEVFISYPLIENYKGRGVNGVINSSFKKLNRVSFSDFELREVATNFLDSISLVNFSNTSFSDGAIGSEILKRFRVVFDYSRNKLYLKKNTNYSDLFTYNMSGLRIRNKDWNVDTLIVEDVRPLSPSAKAGLRANDILLSVNDKLVKRMSFEDIYALLNSVEESPPKVTIKREEEILTFELLLQDIF